MTNKQNGLGDNFYWGGYDLSGDTNSLQDIGGGPAPWETTGIDKSAKERIGLLRDGRISWQSYFNPASNQAHARYKTLPYTDVVATYCRGTTIGKPAACLVSKQSNYDGTRGNDGSVTFSLAALANAYGLEWGDQLTAGKRTDTGAANGASLDGAASSAFGFQAYLQVFSFTGTDATVKIQESSDNGAGDAFADVVGGGFTQITAGPTSQRIATASGLAVERYLRVVTVTTGGFSSLVFSVAVVRNLTAVSF